MPKTRNALDRLAGRIEGNATEVPTKETINMDHRSNEALTTTVLGETPKVRASRETQPGWANEPATDLMLAGLSVVVVAYLAWLSLVQPRPESVSL